jgi:peptidoglycan/xylan/chitin deacetylase (PgdA/CDA1 family)
MKRWIKKTLRTLGSSASSIFIFAIVLIPPTLFAVQVGGYFKGDGRKNTPLPALVQRSVDNGSPQLFKEPLITVTFDDGWETTYTSALPVLQKYGIHSTQYILSGTENDPNYLSWKQISLIQKAGHEIACHTISHPDLTTLDQEELMNQLQGCKSAMEDHKLGPIEDFATPYGSYNDQVISAIKSTYQSHRNVKGVIVDGISNRDVNLSTNFDRYNIIGVTIRKETTVNQLKALVDYAAARNGWLVLTYHQSETGSSDDKSQYGTTIQSLDDQMKYLSGTPYKIVTIDQALKSQPQSQGGK